MTRTQMIRQKANDKAALGRAYVEPRQVQGHNIHYSACEEILLIFLDSRGMLNTWPKKMALGMRINRSARSIDAKRIRLRKQGKLAKSVLMVSV